MATKQDVIEALTEITPAGLFDVCRAFDQFLTTADGSRIIENIEQADELDHEDVNRQEVIGQLLSDTDYTYQHIADYLEL